MSDTPIADTVDEMVARGSSPEMIALVVRSMEHVTRVTRHTASQCDVTVTSHNVTPGAARTARWREKRKQTLAKANDVASVTACVTSVTPERHIASHCDVVTSDEEDKKEDFREEKKEEKNLLPQLVEGRKRGTRLSPDALISESDLQFALAAGMTRERAVQAWAEFIDFWTGIPGQRGVRLSWSGTWRNRVRALTGTGGQTNGYRGSRSFQNDQLSVSKAADRLMADIKAGTVEFAPRPSLLPRESESGARLLPPGRGT